jgi:hypothetical protein
MSQTSGGSEQLKLLDHVLPYLADGRYEARASQSVELSDGASYPFETSFEFYVKGRAFTLAPDSVFSVYPHENAEGNFSNELPFMVLNLKTLPWQYDCGGDPKKPWVALIVLTADDLAEERDISVSELLSGSAGQGVFYPADRQPELYAESASDVCHVVDLPKEVYQAIMPKPEETPYLCHAKYVDLSATEESVSGKDGYFSVVMGNRFIPSDAGEPKKSTVHLVSLLGYDGADSADCAKVRLCSLYRWNVFSQSSAGAGFGGLMHDIDCRQIGDANAADDLRKRGVVVKEYRLRTGETTAALYCSPLTPAAAPKLDMSSRHTADGHLIYDAEKGIFSAQYACAWQLGRMMTLADDALSLKVMRWRRGMAERSHGRLLQANIGARLPDFDELGGKLNVLFGESPVPAKQEEGDFL